MYIYGFICIRWNSYSEIDLDFSGRVSAWLIWEQQETKSSSRQGEEEKTKIIKIKKK